MRTYKMTLISGQVLTIEADGVGFGPGHVTFWNGDRETLVRALRTPAVAEVTEEREP